MLLTAALEQALVKPSSAIYYLAPSRKQAKDIAWRALKDLVPIAWVRKTMESTLSVELNNGSRIMLGGLDYADSLRGQSADLLLLDEFAFASDLQNNWEAALLPMLSTTDGAAIFASTPAGGGNFAAELWERAADTTGWERWNYPSVAGGWILPEFVEEQKATMDPTLWRQEFYGTIESVTGAVFPAFSQQNVGPVVDDGSPIVVGLDFNRSPFCAVILQIQGDTLAAIAEIVLLEADTREMSLEIRNRWPNREVLVCPDPTGSRQQTSSLGLSDHAILKQVGGFKVHSPRAPWAVADKLNSVRLMVVDATGRRRLRIDPSCKRLIRSLRLLEFAPGKSVPDPKSEHGHAVDALGYAAIALSKGLLPWKIGQSGFRLW
jgi:hypothetical protein